MNKESFYQEAQLFLTFLEAQMTRTKVILKDHWTIDHICFRTETQESYEENKKFFSSLGDLLIESPVNGRLIATFKLHEAIHFLGREILLVELPAPKPNKAVKEGFEHVEVVIDQSFAEIRRAYPCHYFHEAGLNKDFNQELEMGFEDCAIKFHHLSLESVINLEKNEKAFKALKNSKVLEKFKKYEPLVAGTFPLNLSHNGSDLDILLHVSDLSELLEFKEYNWKKENIQNQETLMASFDHEGVPFELFAQNTPTHRQVGYLHFQVEERLLRLGGKKLLDKVKEKRKEGLKTEPALAEVLGLSGNPFDEILKLHELSEKDLRELIQERV